MHARAETEKPLNSQAGGTVLTVVAVLGFLLALAQGTVYYRSQGSARFLGTEKNKILAMQMAEAGVEDNIAELGRRRIKPHAGLTDSVTSDHKALEGGSYSAKLTTVAIGAAADTVELSAQGFVGKNSQSIRTRLRLNKYLDTTRTPLVVVTPTTTFTFTTTMVARLDSLLMPALAPSAMPVFNSTPAYTACIGGPAGSKCNVCHVPPTPGTPYTTLISKALVPGHNSHVGDYITTDGTCDLYKDHFSVTTSIVPRNDTTWTTVNLTTYDTTITIDTAVKVQVLSWK